MFNWNCTKKHQMEVPILDEEPVVVIVLRRLRHVRIYVNLPVGRLCRNILIHEQNVILAIKYKSNRPKLNLIAINITLISIIKETKNFDKLFNLSTNSSMQ